MGPGVASEVRVNNFLCKPPALLKCSSLLLMMLLIAPPLAFGIPITTGVWSTVEDVDSDASSFWDGASWDCSTCGVGYLLAGYTGLTNLEYLHNGTGQFVSFRFDDPFIATSLIFNLTAWTSGVLGRDLHGAFTYDSGTGRYSNSSTDNGQQFALFRRVGLETTQYFLGIEDILLSETPNDRDYNDFGVTFTLPNHAVPEPSTLLLMGCSIAGLAFRKRAVCRERLSRLPRM